MKEILSELYKKLETEMVSLNTNISDITFNGCIMNASGALCVTKDNLDNLNSCDSCAIVSKTSTPNLRVGNPKPRWYNNSSLSINSMGLPNLGYNFYLDYALNSNLTKPYIMSLSGNNCIGTDSILKDCLDKSYQLLKNKQILFEINLSCPNIVGKPQIAYDYDKLYEIIDDIYQQFNKYFENQNKDNQENQDQITQGETQSKSNYKIYWGIKLPPYFDPEQFNTVANIIKSSLDNQLNKRCKLCFITCINSIGNGLVVDSNTESTVIYPKEGLGGIGGSVIKSTALANVYMFRKLLPSNIDIIGCGGVTNGEDVFEHLLVGASCVQIGTQLVVEGPAVFKRINQELIEIMVNKGYRNIDNFQGKLKVIKQKEENISEQNNTPNDKHRDHTKIFVIGMNKCASSTIHELFLNNDLKSQHCRYVFEQGEKKDVGWLLDEYDCFSDNGPFDFIELHKKYPNAKFILNTRSLEDWLISRFEHGYRTRKAEWRPNKEKEEETNWAYPYSEELCLSWIKLREEYYQNIIDYFVDYRDNLIVLSIEEKDWISFLAGKLNLKQHNISSQNIHTKSVEYENIVGCVNNTFTKLNYSYDQKKALLFNNNDKEKIENFINNFTKNKSINYNEDRI